MAELIALFVFVDLLLLVLSVVLLFEERRQRRRKAVMDRFRRDTDTAAAPLFKPRNQLTGLARVADRFVDLQPLSSLLTAADTRLSLERFFSVSLGLALLVLVAVLLATRHMFAALPIGVAGGFLPYIYLLRRRKRREQTLVDQLPDTLEMIVRALRAGQSVDGALRELAASSAPPVGKEMRIIYEEMAMGLSFEHALHNMEKRFPALSDVKLMCTAFIVQRETGGNLTKILAGLADTIRHRFQLKRQVQVLTAEGRTSATILGLLPLAFGVITWIFNPDYISLLLSHPLGRKLLFVAFLLVAGGFVLMRLMTRIDV